MALIKTGNILLITSDASFQETLTGSLIAEGFQVESTTVDNQALKELEEKNINLILIDDEAASDIEFALDLKKLKPDVPIIMMVTPYKDSPRGENLFSRGEIDNCILKPFMPQSLICIVENVLTVNYRKVKTERRESVREDTPFDIHYCFIDNLQNSPILVENTTKSMDISAKGLRLNLGDRKNIPNFLELKIFLPEEKSVCVTGKVMWGKENVRDNNQYVGIRFVDFHLEDRQLIANYISL